MTLPDNHIQRNFERSSVQPEERKVDLHHLLELRKTARAAYWAIARDMRGPVPEDLETLMPRATLPKPVDGEVTLRYKDWRSSDENATIESVRYSKTAAEGQALLRLIAQLEQDDPEFIVEYFENLYSSRKVDFIIALHVLGERQEIRDYLIKQTHIDDFLLGIQDKKDAFLDNEFYPLSNHFYDIAKELASAYIISRSPERKDEYDAVPDQELEPFLQFARTYEVTALALEHINTRSPFPKSLSDIHVQGGAGIRENLQTDIDFAQWMLRMRVEFDYMNEAEKLDVGKQYIALLARGYGISPPPSLEIDRESKNLGAHQRWDPDDKEGCFAHPLGRIFVPDMKAGFTDYIETLSHEFTHSLEDAALYSLNPEFQSWCKNNPGAVALGNEKMQKDLRSAAIALSFNAACHKGVGFEGTREVGYNRGVYYSPRVAEDDESGEKQKKINALYTDQLRERHAHLYEYLIRRDVERTLDKIQLCSDPANVVARAHEGKMKVSAFINETLLPRVPEEHREEYQGLVAEIEGHFEKAEAPGISHYERMLAIGRAFVDTTALVGRADGAGYLSLDEEPAAKILVLSCDISEFATQALRIIKHNKSVNDRTAKAGTEFQQVPV